MQTPLQITFRNIESSPAVESKVRERVAELEQFHDRIISCRVMIEAPDRRHHQVGSGELPGVQVEVGGVGPPGPAGPHRDEAAAATRSGKLPAAASDSPPPMQ